MRWIVRICVALVALVVVAVGLLFMLPTDRIGQLASDQLKKQTGRTLTLAGDFSPTLYPTLGVKTGRMTISNADWASEPVMIAADGAAVGVNLMALLGGEVEIEKLELISPVVYLEKAKDGRVNWDLSNGTASDASATPSSGSNGSSGSATPTLELGQISDGQVVYTDRAAGSTVNVTGISGTISLPKASSNAMVDLTATIDGRTASVQGTISDLSAFAAQKSTTINGSVSMGDATIGLNGIAQMTDALPMVDAAFTADIPDLIAVAKSAGIQLPAQANNLKNLVGAGQVRMNDAGLSLNANTAAQYGGKNTDVKIAVLSDGNWLDTMEFEGDLSLKIAGIGSASYNGRFGQGAENFADGDFAANFSDLRGAMQMLDVDAGMPKGTFQSASMSGTFALTPAGKYRLRKAKLRLDENTLTGAISITPKDPRPLLLAQLNGGKLDFSAYTADKSSGARAGSGSGSSAGASSSGWSKDPITLKGLDAIDANVDLRAAGINLGVSQLGKTDVKAKLTNGLLTLTLRDVRAFQGAMVGEINVRGGNTVAFDTDIRANGVQLEPLLGQLLGMDRLGGSGNTTLALRGRGQSLDQIMTSLSGNGSVKFTNGVIKGIDLAGMMRNLKSAFGGFKGATEFSTLDGTFSMDNGVLKNVDLSLISPLFKAGGKGSVDIGGQAMNYVVTPTSLSEDAEFSVPVTITGPWQNLKFRPDLDKLLNLLLQKELKESEEAKKLKKKLDEAKAKLKNPEEEVKKKLKKELSSETDTRSFEDQAKDKLKEEVGNALKKLFD
ncbi:AsmA family protein [Amylibacter sp. IMCC11727]|uniref:AsmA family protein n=1 Tax=Amylibacter sp. IMCC11727 TaxID=3039851 RepID=UPI00244DE92E|nr:AsmA family protein [Amylibacter sp. IMCC11727]WGI21185.1 AsmA family protein [Amylibacter sp. IMCC11727]